MEGVSVFKGIVVAKPLVYKKEALVISFEQVDKNKIEDEKVKYENAFKKTKEQLLGIKEQTLERMSEKEAEIFEAHLTMLEDPMLNQSIMKYLDEGYVSEGAVEKARIEIESLFNTIPDPYIQARIADVNDVVERLIRNIQGKEALSLAFVKEPTIVIAEDLSPSDTAQMNENIKGIITETGSETSHTAIMAKTMGLPALVGVKNAMDNYGNAQTILLDTITPIVLVNPSSQELERYEEKMKQYDEEKKALEALREKRATTKDGHSIQLLANLGSEKELFTLDKFGAEGIGLLRTEFIYMNSKHFPTEEEQYAIYEEIAKGGKEEIIIRTLDIGGDKHLSYYTFDEEMNPFLGHRAIRFCLEKTEVFKAQLRALLRAAVHGPIKIMYPMISSLEQLREANQILESCKNELKEEGKAYKEDIEVGIMIEIPAAAAIADILIQEADFFSIGTNDLCQYTLAVDRMNAKVAKLYEPLHPAVLRLIHQVSNAAHQAGKKVGMCGEMAGHPLHTEVLVGLGLDELSMSPSSVPQVKKKIMEIDYHQAKKLALEVLKCATVEEVKQLLNK